LPLFYFEITPYHQVIYLGDLLKKLISIALALSLLGTAVQPASAKDAYNPDLVPNGENSAIFQIAESGTMVGFSQLTADAKSGDDQWVCDSLEDPECDIRKVSVIGGSGILPPCDSAKDEDCIVSLELGTLEAGFEKAQLIRSLEGMSFPEKKSVNFFQQSTPSLWDAPNAPSASGTTGYAVIVRALQIRNSSDKQFTTESFVASVVPYREAANPNCQSPKQITSTGDPVRGSRSKSVGIEGHGYDSAWSETGICGITQDFSEGTKVRLTIRLAKSVGGWFQGRMKNPVIAVSDFSKDNSEIVVEAEPAQVQRMLYMKDDVKDLTPKERQFATKNGFAGSWDRFVSWSEASRADTFEYLNFFKPKVKDTAAGSNTFWNFSSSGFGQGQCLSDSSKVLGIVTTNSMVYDGGVPKFSRGFLDYRVAGVHFESDGETEVIGSYDLVMRSDVARCLYGFNRAPVSATITISGEGDKSIATTVVSEKNGWLKLAAYGFTFSQKTIKVKLTQKKQTTITCIAPGKKTKKVTAAKPKCPSGFKKK
jgi:hypothetical protein